MQWEIDKDYEIPENLEFQFDYLYEYEWTLNWNGEIWFGNNCVNISYAKISYISNKAVTIDFIVNYTNQIAANYIIIYLICMTRQDQEGFLIQEIVH